MKKRVRQGLLVGAVAALIGFQSTGAAAQGPQTWSIVVHFLYQNGFEFDYVIERGVPTSDIGPALGECGGSHWIGGDIVHYHCYPVPE